MWIEKVESDVEFPAENDYLLEFTRTIAGHKLRLKFVIGEDTPDECFKELWQKIKKAFKPYEEHFGKQAEQEERKNHDRGNQEP